MYIYMYIYVHIYMYIYIEIIYLIDVTNILEIIDL